MDYDNPIMENLHYHAFNYRNAHSTEASKAFDILEEFVSKMCIAAGENWREEWSEACNENQVLINRNQALVEALKTCEVDSDAVGADGGMSFNEDLVSAAIAAAEGKDV